MCVHPLIFPFSLLPCTVPSSLFADTSFSARLPTRCRLATDLVYNSRKRGGDSADRYFKSTELIAGVKDMRFQALMPDVLHWLGIKKIDNMISMVRLCLLLADTLRMRPGGIERVDADTFHHPLRRCRAT